MGQPITVLVPHAVVAILNQKGYHWISPNPLTKYQAVLLDQEDVTLSVASTLNPAILLPMAKQEPLQHDCLATIKQIYASRPDLRDKPLKNVIWNYLQMAAALYGMEKEKLDMLQLPYGKK